MVGQNEAGIRNSALNTWEQRSPCGSPEFPTPSLPGSVVRVSLFRLGRKGAKGLEVQKGCRTESVGLEGFSAGLVAKPTSGCTSIF